MPRCLQGLEIKPILGSFTGEAGTVWPRFKLCSAFFRAPISYALVGMELSSSIVIFGANRGALMVVIGKQDEYLELSDSLNTPIIHLTAANSLPGVAIPTSKVTPMTFGAFGLLIPANCPVGLYASCDATAGNDIFAACSLQLVEVRAGR